MPLTSENKPSPAVAQRGCPVRHFDHRDPTGTIPAVRADYAEMLAGEPISWSDRHGGFWLLSHFDDVKAAASDHARFSSASARLLRGFRPDPVAGLPAVGGPAAAVVFYSGPRDIELVVVEGEVRKRDGVLVGADLSTVRRRVADAAGTIGERCAAPPAEAFEQVWAAIL